MKKYEKGEHRGSSWWLCMGYYIGNTMKRTIAEWTVVPFGLLSYGLLRKRNCYDVLICDHIGDFLYTIGYLKKFKEQNSISYLRIISTKRFEKLAQRFPEACEEYCAVSEKRLKRMLFSYRYRIGRKTYGFMQNVTVIEPASDFLDKYEYVKAFPELTLKESIKYGILKIPVSAKCEAAVGKEKSKEEGTQNTKKRVLLCPQAVVTSWEPYGNLFEALSVFLQKNGVCVYKNDNNNPQIAGTNIEKPLDEFVDFVSDMDCVIGIRSGLLDLAASADCPVIALYPKGDAMKHYFDLRKMNSYNNKIWEYEMKNQTEKDVEYILEILSKQEVFSKWK